MRIGFFAVKYTLFELYLIKPSDEKLDWLNHWHISFQEIFTENLMQESIKGCNYVLSHTWYRDRRRWIEQIPTRRIKIAIPARKPGTLKHEVRHLL